MELSDFNVSVPLTVADFGKLPPTSPNISENNAAQISGAYTILQGGGAADYDKTKGDLLDPARRESFIQLHSQLRDAMWEDAQQSLGSFLTDPNENPQNKRNVVDTVRGVETGQITVSKLPKTSSTEALAQEAAVADNGFDESERTSEMRNSAIDEIGEIVGWRKDVAKAINSLTLTEESNTGKFIKDIGELFVPFAEWIHYDKMSEATGGNTNLAGEQKKRLFELIKATPVDQQAAFAQKIIDLVEENQNVILPDGNTVVAINDLYEILLSNDYSNTDRFIDDATSILDVFFGAGTLAKTALKSKTAAKIPEALANIQKTTSLEEEAEAFTLAQRVADEEARNSKLAKDAQAFKGKPEPKVEDVFPPKPKNTPKKLAEEAKAFKGEPEPTADSVFREAVKEKTITTVSPTSPSQTVKDFNPDLSRQLHKLAVDDETGEAAKALYGTSRTEAIAKDILPEPGINPWEIPHKVEMNKGPSFPLPENIRSVLKENGNTILTDSEYLKHKEMLTSGFRNVEGMTLHPASLVARINPDATMGFTARYSPVDSGFSSSKEVFENAKYAFRHYGLQDDNFSLLKKSGSKWKEVPKTEWSQVKDGEYALGMKYDYTFSADDWTEAELLTTAPGLVARAVQFADRLPSQFLASLGQGSLVQNLLDNASVIHPRILNAASVAVDRAYRVKKVFVDEFDKVVKDYKKLSSDRQALFTDYVKQANLEGIPFSETNLYNRGFTQKEVETLKKWQRANDIMWYANNEDTAISLRANGYMAFTHKGTETKLYGRPVAKVSAEKEKWVFDPMKNKVVSLEEQDWENLYTKNGTAFKLSEPEKIDGHWVDTVISRNTPEAGYLRAIYNGERVLSYQNSYYPVAYNGNYIITKKITKSGKNGAEEHYKAIGVSKTRAEVDDVLKKLRADDSKSEFSFRLDRAHEARQSRIFDEGSWGLSSNAGLTSQKIRGERLGDAGADLHKIGHSHLKDPLEAVQSQIHQLSQRVAMRPYIDSVKKRWMLNYGKYIDLKRSDVTGQLEMPQSIRDVVGKSEAPSKLVADARTNYNYISALENGYINLIDDAYKTTMQLFAQELGKFGFQTAEKVLFKGSTTNPSQVIRSLAFKIFLAASPLRQAVVQRSQIVQMAAINAKYFPNLMNDLLQIDFVRMGVSKSKYYTDLYKELENSGVLEAVNAHSLIRDDLLHLADVSSGVKVVNTAGKIKNTLAKPLNFLQDVGFNAAEQDVLIASWLTHRDLAIKAGKNINDQRVKDEVLGQARAYTLNMNRAGEMPYSQNTLGLLGQFFAFQHKSFMQGISNRSLSGKDRLKILAYTTALWGVGSTPLFMLYNLIPEDAPSETKDVIEKGLFTITLNKGLTMLTGEDQSIDWRGMAPAAANGIGEVLFSMADTPLAAIITGGPSGSLLFGNNPKMTDAFKTGLRFFSVIDDYEDEKLQTSFTDVVKAAVNIFSGGSSFFKARYALQTGMKLSSSGKITDSDITELEAVMTALGFRTLYETGISNTKEVMYGDKAFTEDDVSMFYQEVKRHLARRGMSVAEEDFGIRVLQEAWRVFGDDRPEAVKLLKKRIEADAQNGDYAVYKGIINSMGFKTEAETWDAINSLPAGPARDNLTKLMQTREDLNDGN